jgi:hypothetical protein
MSNPTLFYCIGSVHATCNVIWIVSQLLCKPSRLKTLGWTLVSLALMCRFICNEAKGFFFFFLSFQLTTESWKSTHVFMFVISRVTTTKPLNRYWWNFWGEEIVYACGWNRRKFMDTLHDQFAGASVFTSIGMRILCREKTTFHRTRIYRTWH